MTTTEQGTSAVMDTIQGARDTLSVRRVFGDAYELDGVRVIPVARVSGGAGGGGGEGGSDAERGAGFGTGFGMEARPVGVYEIHDGTVAWRPAVDVTRLARGGQVLVAILAICLTLVRLRSIGRI